jgi:hypothetical protein
LVEAVKQCVFGFRKRGGVWIMGRERLVRHRPFPMFA